MILIQFHWNDYSNPAYITALQQLQDLQKEGLISALGLCNFDAIRMDEVCTTLGPGSIVSNQVQVRLNWQHPFPPLPRSDRPQQSQDMSLMIASLFSLSAILIALTSHLGCFRILIILVFQFSLIDTRALHGMVDVCQKHGAKLLTYGTLVSTTSLYSPSPFPFWGFRAQSYNYQTRS